MILLQYQKRDTCMWESIPPNRTVVISASIKKEWANFPISNKITSMDVLKYTDFEWHVFSPDSETQSQAPASDHTLGKRAGNYLLLNIRYPRLVGDRAVLVSDHYDIDSNRSFCFQLYYYFKNSGSPGDSRFEVYQAENNNQYQKVGQVIEGTSNNKGWTKFEVTAKAMSTYSKNMWFYLVCDFISICVPFLLSLPPLPTLSSLVK